VGSPRGQGCWSRRFLAERTDAQALRFYARRGFQEVGRLPGFVRPGREEVILWRGPAT
jgi:hypothetical protein